MIGILGFWVDDGWDDITRGELFDARQDTRLDHEN